MSRTSKQLKKSLGVRNADGTQTPKHKKLHIKLFCRQRIIVILRHNIRYGYPLLTPISQNRETQARRFYFVIVTAFRPLARSATVKHDVADDISFRIAGHFRHDADVLNNAFGTRCGDDVGSGGVLFSRLPEKHNRAGAYQIAFAHRVVDDGQVVVVVVPFGEGAAVACHGGVGVFVAVAQRTDESGGAVKNARAVLHVGGIDVIVHQIFSFFALGKKRELSADLTFVGEAQFTGTGVLADDFGGGFGR